MLKYIICLNLDTVKNKNLYQYDSLSAYGYYFIALGYLKDKTTDESQSYEYYQYPENIFKRLLFVLNIILKKIKNIHHVELYTGGGRFLILEYIVCKILCLKVCVVERGSPLRDIDSRYGWTDSYVRKYIFRKSTYVWIRELWMKRNLSKLGRDDYFFLPNAVRVPSKYETSPSKPVTFIWVNSFVKIRKPEWFVEAFRHPSFDLQHGLMLGLLQNNAATNVIQNKLIKNKPANIEVLPFQNPSPYFIRSKFFILASDVVYLNFSLLEAMAYGVVPIISDVEGAKEIVDDGVDGFIVSHSKEAFACAMRHAMQLSPEDYIRMATSARKKIIDKYSIDTWAESLNRYYVNM